MNVENSSSHLLGGCKIKKERQVSGPDTAELSRAELSRANPASKLDSPSGHCGSFRDPFLPGRRHSKYSCNLVYSSPPSKTKEPFFSPKSRRYDSPAAFEDSLLLVETIKQWLLKFNQCCIFIAGPSLAPVISLIFRM